MDGLDVVSTEMRDAVTGKTAVDLESPLVLSAEVRRDCCCSHGGYLSKYMNYKNRNTSTTVVSWQGRWRGR